MKSENQTRNRQLNFGTLCVSTAFILTYISYKWLTKLVEKGKLWKFSIYLIIVAIFTIIYFI